jgi:hypothetical protein
MPTATPTTLKDLTRVRVRLNGSRLSAAGAVLLALATVSVGAAPANAVGATTSTLSPVTVSLSTARAAASANGCAVKLVGKTAPYIPGSVVRMRSLDGRSLGKAKVSRSGGGGRFVIRKLLECSQELLARPVASGVDGRGRKKALTGVGLARTIVLPSRPAPVGTRLMGEMRAATLTVVDHEASAFPGQIPAACPDLSIAPGAPIVVLDAVSGAPVARGAVGACNGYTTSRSTPMCVPGIGCLPPLATASYSAQLFGPLPVLPSYTFKVGEHVQEFSLVDAEAANWSFRLGVGNS